MSAIALQVFESLVADGMGETQARAVAKATDATIADAKQHAAEFAELDKQVATGMDFAKLEGKIEAMGEKMGEDGSAIRERLAGLEAEVRLMNRVLIGPAVTVGGACWRLPSS